jgi:hypothetical protein
MLPERIGQKTPFPLPSSVRHAPATDFMPLTLQLGGQFWGSVERQAAHEHLSTPGDELPVLAPSPMTLRNLGEITTDSDWQAAGIRQRI